MATAPTPSYTEVPFEYSRNLPGILGQLGLTVAVSTYQAGKLVLIGGTPDGLEVSLHTFDRVMGVAFKPDALAVATRQEIWFLRSAPSIARRLEPAGTHDACFLA